MCFEAEHAPWTYFAEGSADAILWPGYWGWTLIDEWSEERAPGKPNSIHANMRRWRMPLVQANFAKNDLEGRTGPGPEGLSFVVDGDNRLVHRGPHLEAEGFLVRLCRNEDGRTAVVECLPLA
jgi:hypothetical protein